ncbi:hypothetical protein AXF42_Ash012191 [Apostasia shenzhenica]|uniref:Uncharacterized protein n=1 Tax=Apostasia shenzhenica TaxID=1088818 RepID=A0A2I0B489_9ASPA|nr:hypothetical protein AXF42_Ash012191 [Apostasia shenzhenica]
MEAQQGSEFRAFRETHRGLKWFREVIPYVHRMISEGVSLIKKGSLKGLYNVFLGRRKKKRRKLHRWGFVTMGVKKSFLLFLDASAIPCCGKLFSGICSLRSA